MPHESLVQWSQALDSLRHQFEHARPFRYILMDDVLPEPFVDEAIVAFPPIQLMEHHSHSPHTDKTELTSLASMAEPFRRLHQALTAPVFLEELSEVTGIASLLTDDAYADGGLHQGGDGSFLDVHVDQNFLAERQLHRRLNLILYFSRGWEAAWGGALELWNPQMTRAEATILPAANRCVLFETTDVSYHGYRKIALPKGSTATRKSFSIYYYTQEKPDNVRVNRTARFHARPDDPLLKKMSTGFSTMVHDLIGRTGKS